MNGADARAYLLSLTGAHEDYPFGPDVAVMKIGQRMFATLSNGPAPGAPAFRSQVSRDEKSADSKASVYRMNLKCDPHEADMLRDMFTAIVPGYHMNKRHWNTVYLDGSIPRGEIERMIDSSRALVVAGLTRRERQALGLELSS